MRLFTQAYITFVLQLFSTEVKCRWHAPVFILGLEAET